MKNKKKGLVPAFLSVVWLTGASVGGVMMYAATKYLPLLLFAFVAALPAAVNFFILIFGFDAKGAPKIPDPGDKKGFARFMRRVRIGLTRAAGFLSGVYSGAKKAAAVVTTVLSVLTAQLLFWLVSGRVTSVYKMTYLTPVILVLLFVSFIVFEKWCAHAADPSDGYTAAVLRNLETGFITARFAVVLTVAASVIKLLGFYELQQWLVWGYVAVFCYESVFVLISMTVRLIRREFASCPDTAVMIPFAAAKHDFSVLSYLEKNTGITMRSLWSIKLIKQILPAVAVAGIMLFWLGTGIVQIESYQSGAVYRFGKLSEKTLGPGLHMTLPWPIDRVEVYDTDSVKRLTVGYISSENSDNVWTSAHGSSEYKLLLGGGNELVSINLRIEYKISDLEKYLQSSSAPEKLLEARAYELVTDKTIGTDLNSIMSVDRSEFSEQFKNELAEKISANDTGLEVVSVVLESIHPPVDIASVYQEIISAGIDADRFILEAEAKAAVGIAGAEQESNTIVNSAYADSYGKKAAATASVAEFMAYVEADGNYHDSFRNYKYLKALGQAYGSSRLILIGEGIDPSNIYYGNVTPTIVGG